MHLHRKVLRNIICAAALVTLALPVTTSVATPVTHAQTANTTPSALPSGCTPSTLSTTAAAGTTGNCYVDATPPVAFNPIGTPHTVTFTCDALTNTLGIPGALLGETATGLDPGCYDVTATATDITTGSPATINAATCGNQVAAPVGGSVDCTGVNSPICPVGTVPRNTGLFLGGTTIPCAPNCPTGFTATPATGTTAGTCTLPIAAGDVTPAQCTGGGGTVTNGTCVGGTFGGSTVGFPTTAACTAAGGTANTAGTVCTIAPLTGAVAANTATVTFNPGAPHAYTVDFTGYLPASSLGSCPAGTTPVTTKLTASIGEPPVSIALPAMAACRFTVEVQKKYVEITKITLTGGPCGGSLFFAEGLKAFFGPKCTVTAAVTGTVTLKTGVNCANEPAPGSPAGGDFPSGSTYNCVNGSLIVENIPLTGVPLTFQVTGPGSFNVLNNLSNSCSGVSGVTSANGVSGTPVTFCPTGPGAGSIQACLNTGPNNQPTPICSNSISFTFTENARRVVPYVRWAGEKIALTKCFGPALAFSPIEFNLQGSNPGLDATLIPTDLASTLGSTGVPPNQSTIWAVTDANGCASVLGYAAGEGVMYVDAAIFNVSGPGIAAGAPIVNEHAFEVFYLKFDHVDLENINPTSVYSSSTALTPYLSFFSGTPAVNGATFFPSTFTLPSAPGANGQVAGPTGYAVPLCQTQYVRAMVHGYFEIPGDPSGRPATSVAIPGTPISSGGTPSTGSFVLPAGRWVLPEDWPVLATFAGFSSAGAPNGSFTPSSVLAWDLNSGWVFNPSGENPVFCQGNGLFAPDAEANGTGEGVLFSNNNGGYGNIAAGSTDLGPCFSKDGAGTFYSTAGPGYTNACTGGETVGIGPFDATQACTDPFPLTYSPSGSTLIGGLAGLFTCPAGVTAPCLIPAGLNSTYLPNGTLNQWDAPMPPAQISFGITGGPGFLDEVNKTGLYSLIFDAGAPAADGTCPTGYAVSPVTGTCHLDVDPNPFYAEAIPASPFIPNITNNGGYLWNSWNFSSGTVTAVSSTGVFGAPAGGFVPGQSTTVPVSTTTLPFACPTTSIMATLSGTTCTMPGGINVTACTSTTTSDSVIVGNGAGFLPGMSVEVYDAADGDQVAGGTGTGPVIQAVLPSPQTGFPNAVELVFAHGALTGAGACPSAPFTDVFIAEQFGLPVPSVAPFTAQASGSANCGGIITIGSGVGAGLSATSGGNTFPVLMCDTTNNIVYVGTTATVADIFGPCTGPGSGVSRAGGPSANPFCEPNLLVRPGTLIETGPKGAGGLAAGSGPPPNPYPFWQWVPAPPGKGSAPKAGTVYSDNHGEAVVSLSTAVATQVPPVSGACPTGYIAQSINGTILTCQLPFSALGGLGYASVAAALSNFSASKPGCIQTYPSGTFAVLANATIGATGPAAGQICINALGGIEFGASASLGTTTVSAIADYPYTRGEHPPIASANLTKVWTSLFQKSLTVSAGTPGPAGTTSYTVTITAKDVCGNPLFGEPIEVYALGNAGASVLASIATTGGGVLLTQGSNNAVVTVDPTTGQATLSLEVLNTAIGTQGLVIKAVFRTEGVERFVTVIPGTIPGAVVNQPYGPGWQMVGGPANTNFSTSEALFAWDPVAGAYVNASASASNISSAPPGCTGYWAYFAAAMVVQIPATSTSGQTAACTLKAGWNLVGNPFSTPANLPSGTTAYYWNGTSYTTVGQIPVGGSVWIYNDGTLNALTLTAT